MFKKKLEVSIIEPIKNEVSFFLSILLKLSILNLNDKKNNITKELILKNIKSRFTLLIK